MKIEHMKTPPDFGSIEMVTPKITQLPEMMFGLPVTWKQNITPEIMLTAIRFFTKLSHSIINKTF